MIEDDDTHLPISEGDKTRKHARKISDNIDDRKRTRVTYNDVIERKRARDNSGEEYIFEEMPKKIFKN